MNEELNKNQQELFEQPKKNDWLKKIKVDDFKFELTLFFILGFLLGFTLKTEAAKKITIGFNDYKVLRAKQGYDLDKLKSDLEKKAAEQQQAIQAQNPQVEPQK